MIDRLKFACLPFREHKKIQLTKKLAIDIAEADINYFMGVP